jgi:hypothetical protein
MLLYQGPFPDRTHDVFIQEDIMQKPFHSEQHVENETGNSRQQLHFPDSCESIVQVFQTI